jgi:hypothetical protein
MLLGGYYTNVLGRPAGAAGGAWRRRLEDGAVSAGQVAEGLLASDEFFARLRAR